MSPERPTRANDPLGCLFDIFSYSLIGTAGVCAWVWYRAGEDDLPAIAAEMVEAETVRWVAVIFFVLCLLGVVILRFWGLRMYHKMLDD